MSAACRRPSEDHFLCSICLEVLAEPVTTSCGHNFCRYCITVNWNINNKYQCPMCKEVFPTRPDLKINTLLSQMVDQFRLSSPDEASSRNSEQMAEPGDVQCDICTGTKLKALKSCLVCLVSFCQTHLEPHLTAQGLRRHQLIEPVENLEGRMCGTHDKPLEFFCKSEQTCICLHCTYSDHKTHDVAPLKEESNERKAELRKTEAEIQLMIQERRLKIEEIQHSVDISEEGARREVQDCVRVFTALMESVEKNLNDFVEAIEEKRRATKNQAQDVIKELEQEISELMERSSEVEQLSHSEDHLHLLQSLPTLKAAPAAKDWTHVSVRPPSYEGTVVKAVAQLEETLSKDTKKLFDAELKRVQQYQEDVTLDPDTAHPKLLLSDDGKQVCHSNKRKNLPDNPERFSYCVCVLGKQSFSSGRFYFQVQVGGKTRWDVGVARASINRKVYFKLRPRDGFWTIYLRKGNVFSLASPDTPLALRCQPQTVGVFVDHDQGLVSFYDVDAAALIFSFTGCSFSGSLHPFFSPCNNEGGRNAGPLIICPVDPTA
ncbi:E3 ubiquitin-protein ligase TRIM21-like [Aulostomus maculatus]